MLCFGNSTLFAKNNLIPIPDVAIENILDSAYDCRFKEGSDCAPIYLFAIKKGKELKVEYMDYLNFSYAFYLSSMGRFDTALKIIEETLPLSKNDIVIEGLINTQASIFYNQGHTEKAIKYFIQLAKLLEKRGEFHKLALTYTNIGIILGAQENYQRSLDFLLKADNLVKNTADSFLIITLRANIAAAYLDLKDYKAASHWARLSINTKSKIEWDESGKAIAYRVLAQSYKQTNTDSALFFINKSIETSKEFNDQLNLGTAFYEYALIMDIIGNYKSAQSYIDKSISIHREVSFLPGIVNSLLFGGKISIRNKQFEKAANYLLEANILNDSIKSEKNYKTISALTTKYETEKKERQIVEKQLEIERKNEQIHIWTIIASMILISGIVLIYQLKKNQKIKIKILQQENENELLKAQVKGEEIERGRVSRELHDGVASSLLVTRLQLEKNTTASNNNAIIMIKDLHKEIRNIAHKLNPIDFKEKNWIQELNNYCANIQSEKTQVHFLSNIKELILEPTKLLVLFRAIQEVLQNAIKHANARNISIQIVNDSDALNISIEDDGNGTHQSILDNADSLNNLRARLKEIDASLQIESKINEGLVAFIQYEYKLVNAN